MDVFLHLIQICLFGILYVYVFCGASTDTAHPGPGKVEVDIAAEVGLLRQLLGQETIMRMAMEKQMVDLRAELERVKHSTEQCGATDQDTKQETSGGGEVYVRWGKSTCVNGSTTIYSGQVGGSNNYQQSGAAVDHLCLPPDPIYDQYDPKMNNHAFVFGAEFDIYNIDIKGTLFDKAKYTTQGVSCSVCRPDRPSTVLMIPGRNACYEGMTIEYSGYLMAGYHAHKAASEYICVDGDADIYPRPKHAWSKILYPVESVCDGPLKCPPYINGAEMTCVVCSIG